MKPFDYSKFRKNTNKALGITDGFHDPKIWINTGNYALNYRISSSFRKGVPLGKVTVFAGESGSGKSFVCSGNIVREAQKKGIFTIILDSEFALDRSWMEDVGVDTSEDKLIRYSVDLIDECATIVTNFMNQYRDDYGSLPYEEMPPVLFVIDSIGMLSTPTEKDQFEKGDMKGDMGRKAKQLKALVTQCLKLFGPYPIGLVATAHVYASQDVFAPDPVVSGGSGFIFASSIIVGLQKLKLKEDENGQKTTDVLGIRSKMKVIKSRYAKPFEEVEVKIPYEKGMDPYSGLVEMFEKMGHLVKDGNKLKYTDLEGNDHKFYRKDIPDTLLDMIMDRVEAETDRAKVEGVKPNVLDDADADAE